MILREPSVIGDGGVVTIEQKPPVVDKLAEQKPQPERKPTAEELKREFKIEPGDADFVESFPVEQLPKQKAEEVKKVEDTKKETEPELPAVDLDKPIVPTGTKQIQRDYSGFNAEEAKMLKAMSNESFAYASNLIKQNKELAQLKDATYLQHPNAYVLDPQFQEEQQNLQYFQQEGEYWQQQLALIKEGKDWQPLKGWDDKGRPVLAEARKATVIDEEQVRMAMNQSFNAVQQSQTKLQQFGATYNQRIQAGDTAIRNELAKRCGWVSDPKLLDEKIQTGAGEQTLKSVIEGFKNLLPVYHRGHIMTEVAANLWAALQIYGHQIRLLQNGKQVKQLEQDEIKRAEPTSTQRPAASSGKAIRGVKEFSMDGMQL